MGLVHMLGFCFFFFLNELIIALRFEWDLALMFSTVKCSQKSEVGNKVSMLRDFFTAGNGVT